MTAQPALAPTPERIRHQRSSYRPPEKGQKVDRPYGQFRSWFDTVAHKSEIDGPMYMAGSRIDHLWRVANQVPGLIGSYGDQRWSTPIAHMSPEQLLKPEMKEEAHRQLTHARMAIKSRMEWDALTVMIRRDDGDMREAAMWLGYSKSYAEKKGPELVKRALVQLALHFGYVKHYHPPR